MPFVIQSGSRQYLVEPGQKIIVNKLDAQVDSTIELDLVYAFGEHKKTTKLTGKIVGHQRGEKIRVVKYKAKSNYKRSYGPRQEETIIEIASK
jgi:large subunit ribosomal protein L21